MRVISFQLVHGTELKHLQAKTIFQNRKYLLQSVAEFLDEIQAKVLRVFLPAIHSQLHSFALRFLFLQTHATSYIFLQTHATSYVCLQ